MLLLEVYIARFGTFQVTDLFKISVLALLMKHIYKSHIT